MATKRIFVYGSLMENFFNYDKYLKGNVLARENGYVVGTLYHLVNKGYPGFVKIGNDRVYGEILTIKSDQKLVEALDQLEGYSGAYHGENAYNRFQVAVHPLENNKVLYLDAYVYNIHAPCNHTDERLYLENGSWRQYMEENY